MFRLAAIALAALLAACDPAPQSVGPSAATPDAGPGEAIHVAIETEAGRIVVALYPDAAPVSVANFIAHAEAGHFDGGSFYRTVREDNDRAGAPRIDVIQGGVGFDGLPGAVPIAHETTAETGLSHTPGAISMARLDVGTATTEFFIVVNDSTTLDSGPGGRNPDEAGYAVFGQVVEGMDVVRAIWTAPAGDEAGPEGFQAQWLNPAVTIQRVERAD